MFRRPLGFCVCVYGVLVVLGVSLLMFGIKSNILCLISFGSDSFF